MRRQLRNFGAASIVVFTLLPTPVRADGGADLQVSAHWVGRGVPRAAVGRQVTFDITVTNLGPQAAVDVYVFALTPDQFNPVSLTCSVPAFCSAAGGELAPGETVTATIVDVVCCFPKGETRTTSAGATVFSATADPDRSNDVSSVRMKIVGPHGFSVPG